MSIFELGDYLVDKEIANLYALRRLVKNDL